MAAGDSAIEKTKGESFAEATAVKLVEAGPPVDIASEQPSGVEARL